MFLLTDVKYLALAYSMNALPIVHGFVVLTVLFIVFLAKRVLGGMQTPLNPTQ